MVPCQSPPLNPMERIVCYTHGIHCAIVHPGLSRSPQLMHLSFLSQPNTTSMSHLCAIQQEMHFLVSKCRGSSGSHHRRIPTPRPSLFTTRRATDLVGTECNRLPGGAFCSAVFSCRKERNTLPSRSTLPQSGYPQCELNGHPDGQSQPASSSNYIPLSADRTFLGTTDDYTGPHSPWPSTVSLESAAPSKWPPLPCE